MTAPAPAPGLLKSWREAENLSQGEAAKLLEVSQPSWSDYEQGNKVPRTVLAVKIAALTKGAVPVESWLPPSSNESKGAA